MSAASVARFYDPANSRFLTQDTYRGKKEEPSSLHLYAYCANNPINYTDPTGHKKYKKTFQKVAGEKGQLNYMRYYATVTVNINNKTKKIKKKNFSVTKGCIPGFNRTVVEGKIYFKKKIASSKKSCYVRVGWPYVDGTIL